MQTPFKMPKKQLNWPVRKDGVTVDARFKAPTFLHTHNYHAKDRRYKPSTVAQRKILTQAFE